MLEELEGVFTDNLPGFVDIVLFIEDERIGGGDDNEMQDERGQDDETEPDILPAVEFFCNGNDGFQKEKTPFT